MHLCHHQQQRKIMLELSVSSSSSSHSGLSLLIPTGRPAATGGGGSSCLISSVNNHRHEKGRNLRTSSRYGPSCLQPPSAQSRRSPPGNNMNEDMDEMMLNDLLKKHGKVVYKRGEPNAEADYDAECLSFAVSLAKVANDVKAADIRVLFVKPLVYWTRFFIIATAFSLPQIDAIGSRIREIAEKQFRILPISGDSKPNAWTLLDFGDVVVHIFLPQQRAYYNLEEFYANATPIQLPFESETSPFRSYDAFQ